MVDTDNDEVYLSAARQMARIAHSSLSKVTASRPDNTLGGLARTLVGLMADGADPRQLVYLELVDEPFQGSMQGRVDEPTRFEHQTSEFSIRGDGTDDGEEVTLSFRADTLEQI